MNAEHRIVGSDLRRPWLVANFLAFTVGGALAGGLLRFLEQPYYEKNVSAIEAAYVQASSLGLSETIFGAMLGTAQWLVLRRAFRAGWWMPATCRDGHWLEPSAGSSPVGPFRRSGPTRDRCPRSWLFSLAIPRMQLS